MQTSLFCSSLPTDVAMSAQRQMAQTWKTLRLAKNNKLSTDLLSRNANTKCSLCCNYIHFDRNSRRDSFLYSSVNARFVGSTICRDILWHQVAALTLGWLSGVAVPLRISEHGVVRSKGDNCVLWQKKKVQNQACSENTSAYLKNLSDELRTRWYSIILLIVDASVTHPVWEANFDTYLLTDLSFFLYLNIQTSISRCCNPAWIHWAQNDLWQQCLTHHS